MFDMVEMLGHSGYDLRSSIILTYGLDLPLYDGLIRRGLNRAGVWNQAVFCDFSCYIPDIKAQTAALHAGKQYSVTPIWQAGAFHPKVYMAYCETLQQLGIPARIKHMHDFDWRGKSSRPSLAILPNVAALSIEQATGIEAFVKNGNSVLLTGLTGLYDPADRFWPLAKHPLEDLLGATLKELRVLDENCRVSLQNPSVNLPCQLWVGEIDNHSAEPIGKQDGWVTAVRNRVGHSQAIWIPALIGLGAWQSDNRPLAQLLKGVTRAFTQDLPFQFTGQQPGCLMRVMQSGGSYITVVTNGGTEPKRCRIQHPEGFSPNILWGEASSVSEDGGEVALGPTGTVVVAWRRSSK